MKDSDARQQIYILQIRVTELEDMIERNGLGARLYTSETNIDDNTHPFVSLMKLEQNRLNNSVPMYKAIRMILDHLGLYIKKEEAIPAKKTLAKKKKEK